MAHGTYNNPRAGSNSSKNRMKSMVDKVNDPKKSKTIYGESSGTQSEKYTKKDGSKSDVYRRGSKTKAYLAPGTEQDPRYEGRDRAYKNPQSSGYKKKNKDIEILIDKYGATKTKGSGNARNISEKRANRIIDRYARRKDRQ
jgi:hypothetical protein